jgi:hypothetical protein
MGMPGFSFQFGRTWLCGHTNFEATSAPAVSGFTPNNDRMAEIRKRSKRARKQRTAKDWLNRAAPR